MLRPAEDTFKKAEVIFTFKLKSNTTYTAQVTVQRIYKGNVAKEVELVVSPESRYSFEGVRVDAFLEDKTYLVEAYEAPKNNSIELGDCRQPKEISKVAERISWYEKNRNKKNK